jgi:hypothetical protein
MMGIKLLHNRYFRLKRSESTYGSVFPKFAIGDKTKNTIKATSYFAACRETLGNQFRYKVNKSLINAKVLNLLIWFAAPGSVMVLKNGKATHITEHNKENYFEWLSTRHSESVYRALHVLNIIEKELKWKRTTVKKITHRFSNKHDLYLFVASPKWMFSPPLLSLYTLIIRSGTFKSISKIKSIGELSIAYNKTIEKHVPNQRADVSILKEISPWLKKLLVNVNEIYKGRTRKINFDKTVLSNDYSSFSEGITKLVRGETSDKLILERLLKYTCK